MADFCRQCSAELFGPDLENDMSGRVTEPEFLGGFVGTGLCEGCAGGEFALDGSCLGSCEKPEHGEVVEVGTAVHFGPDR